jgi:hypothetical protein
MATTYININGDVRDAASLNVPQHRAFRGAWEYNDDVVKTDMPKAVEIQQDKIRVARAPEMDKLDVEFMRKLEQGADVAPVSAKKATLRDITADARLAAATTSDELKVLDLAALLGE